MRLAFPNRHHQRNPEGVMQAAFNWVCHECGCSLQDVGASSVQWRCVNRDCWRCSSSINTKEVSMPSNLSLSIFWALASIVAILLDAPDLVTGACGGAFLLAGFLALGEVTDEPFDVGEPE